MAFIKKNNPNLSDGWKKAFAFLMNGCSSAEVLYVSIFVAKAQMDITSIV